MKKQKVLFLLLLGMIVFGKLSAQESLKDELPFPVELSLELKNAHIWRGLEVGQNALIDANLRAMDRSRTFAFGIWGATTFQKDFKEFDYYVGFYKGGFSLEVWDIFNFSDKNAFDPITNTGYNTNEAFDYDARTTGHFIDVILGYNFGPKFPLNLKWSTIVYGRDRARISYQDPVDPSIFHQKYSKSRFTSYVEASYPILRHNIVDVNIGVAGAFALKSAKIDGQKIEGNFYGKSGGIINVNLALSKKVKITDSYTLPITATAVWNPEASKTYLQIALQVLQF